MNTLIYVNLCDFDFLDAQIQHVLVVAIFVGLKLIKASAGAARQAVKPSQLRKHEIFRKWICNTPAAVPFSCI